LFIIIMEYACATARRHEYINVHLFVLLPHLPYKTCLCCYIIVHWSNKSLFVLLLSKCKTIIALYTQNASLLHKMYSNRPIGRLSLEFIYQIISWSNTTIPSTRTFCLWFLPLHFAWRIGTTSSYTKKKKKIPSLLNCVLSGATDTLKLASSFSTVKD